MRVLMIGNLSGELAAASHIASKRGAKVKHAPSIEVAINALRAGAGADIILIDVLADIGRLVNQLGEEHIHIPVVACGFNHTPEEAAGAIVAGAIEYLPLPPNEELIAAILENIAGESHIMLGTSPLFRTCLALADQVAASTATVLITGASGTGKEVMARYVHKKSKRAGQVFISINCAAVPENLLESELFGHEKGAFTGAVARRVGKFEEAHGGTLLLDEISEIDIRLQAKLLRALQEREIDRVGGGRAVPVDIRVIATSNRDLKEEVKAGRFREDLYFRLNIIELKLPALAGRVDDIAPLAEFFKKKYLHINGLPEKSFTEEALETLKSYPWPGNVRELENTIHRAVLLSPEDTIRPEVFMLEERAEEGMVGRTLASVERDLIVNTLHHCLGDSNRAATLLGISLKHLREKLAQFEVQEGA
jgi:two-component system response regulator FlrC